MSIPQPAPDAASSGPPNVTRRAADSASSEITLNHSHYDLYSAGSWRGASLLLGKK
jgi:hypothetical protein